ncbi:GerAB/ArcD/ProY family transporter [Paenibacillus abyssi]|uniref:Germination protein n=1 Tax=Paenibacillus abyssi TaxID=1340531 RepID=A0A917CZF5_9BACL|nr:endospore germination permease [Paenibacillus abyssi]GGG03220.1 germination protein [Paenibacillus abyssi]
MIENGKISLLQFGIAVYMFALGSTALLAPSIIVSIAKQDGWISVIFCMLVIVAFVSLWSRLSKRYPGQSMIQYGERILGTWPGKLVGLIYIWYFLYLSSLVLRNLGDFITTSVLSQTPIQFVHIMFMIPVLYGAYLGLEVIARTGEVLFPWILVIFSVTILLLLKNIDPGQVLPILPDGLLMPLKGVYPLLGFPISELVVFLLVIPFVKGQNKIKKYFNLYFLLAAATGACIVFISISVLGVDVTARSTFSVFDMAKEINVGNFFERVEVLVGGIWMMTIFVKLSICFYAANLATAQLFNLRSYRVTLLPFGMFVLALSILGYKNTAESAWFITTAYPIYSLFHGLVIPALLLMIGKLRRLKG